MKAEVDIKNPNLLFAFVLAVSGATSALDLSGKVVNTDGTGRGGVAVSLSGTTLSAVTASDGTWALAGTTGVPSRSVVPASLPGNLRIHGGRVGVVLSGRNLSGRLLSGGTQDAGRSTALAARVLGSGPDTLVYRFNGKVFLRDTVSESRSGMVRGYDTTWNDSIVYGYLIDVRDGQTYRTVKIGTQVWMAQNLNWAGAGVCPGDSGSTVEGTVDSCARYGRLYSWAEVMQGSSASGGMPSGVKGGCPLGWHVPSDWEWIRLVEVDHWPGMAGKALKSTFGWMSSITGNDGTDAKGFRAIPSGNLQGGVFQYVGTRGYWWSASEYLTSTAWAHKMEGEYTDVVRDYYAKTSGFSLRCIQD